MGWHVWGEGVLILFLFFYLRMDGNNVKREGNARLCVLAIINLTLLPTKYIQIVETPQFLRSSYRASLLYERGGGTLMLCQPGQFN